MNTLEKFLKPPLPIMLHRSDQIPACPTKSMAKEH